MTITRIERLVRRVRAALQTQEPGGSQLSGELAEVCQETNRRIEQCLGSLRRADLSGAMDLSESEPPLAECIRALSFAEFDPWVQRCREQGWMIPEAPDLRGFQSLQKSFLESRGKEADPALVESFRAAMVAGDRGAALRTLTTILRRRPTDTWALAEKGKLLAKESEHSLRQLESFMVSGDDSGLVKEMERFGKLGLDPKYRPEIHEAARLRCLEVGRIQAMVKLESGLKHADQLKSTGQWREVAQILERVAAELEEVGARPPGGHLWNELHQWVREKSLEDTQREQLRKQEERVGRELDALERMRREGTRRSSARMRESLKLLEEFADMAGGGGAGWPEAIHQRLRFEAEQLAMDLRIAKKKQWIWAGAGIFMVFVGLGSFFQWKQEEIRQQIFLGKIGQMIKDRKVEEAQAWLGSEEAKKAAVHGGGAAQLAKLRAFVEAEEQRRQAAEQMLARLEKKSSDRGVSLSERWHAWDEWGPELQKVYPPWRSSLEDRENRMLAVLRDQAREFRGTRERELRASLKKVQSDFAAWERVNQNRSEDATKLQPMLDQLAAGVEWQGETLAELAMPEDLNKEFSLWLNRLIETKTRLDDFSQAALSLARATTLAEYRSALDGYAGNSLIPLSEKEKINQVLSAWREPFDLLAGLWLPWLSPPPAGLVGGVARLVPAHLTQAEDVLLKEILEDDYLQDIWVYQVPDATNSKERHILYARGKLAVIPGTGSESPYTYGKGEVFIPRGYPRDEPIQFEPRPRTQALKGIRQDMEQLLIGFGGQVRCMPETNSEKLKNVSGALERALSSDQNVGLNRAPIQTALQDLLSPQPGTSPLARAYLAAKVWKLAMMSKDSMRFGVCFSPSLFSITQNWNLWGAVEPGIWLKEDKGGADSEWSKAFTLPETPKLAEEAKLAAQLWSRAGKEGLSYGGSVDGEGRGNFERLVNLEAGQILVGQGLKGELGVAWRYDGKKWLEGCKVRPYSPLFLLPRNPENLLLEAIREARVDSGWAKDWVLRFLPLLFGGSEGASRH